MNGRSGIDREDVRRASRLEDTITALTGQTLRPNGRGEPAIVCPWHEDAHPSLRVNLDKQCWYCDPCDTGGDVFAFVERYQQTDFKGALRWLAERAGLHDVQPKIVAVFDYVDAEGRVRYQSCRLEPGPGGRKKTFRQRRPDGRGGWINNMDGVTRVPYRLHEIKGKDVVYIPEGEAKADLLWTMGLPATCSAGGAGKWEAAFSVTLHDLGIGRVVALADNDDPGRAHAEDVARSCHAAGLQVKVVTLPDLPPKGDIIDWFAAGHTRDELIAIRSATALYVPSSETPDQRPDTISLPDTDAPLVPPADVRPELDASQTKARESQATAVVRLVTEAGAELWHTSSGDAYISVRTGAHVEYYPLSSRATKDYLSRAYFMAEGKAPNASALADAINTLSGIARFDGGEHPVHVRVAGHQDRIYLDLCDSEWRAVEITSDGWDVLTRPPVRFRRAKGMLALPVPQRGGSITELRPFVNVASDDDFVLIVSWLVQALRPSGPYPVMIALGEQGSSKSTFCRILRRLIDPNVADTRSEPREARDLAIAADNGFVICFDNLSRLPEWLSDALCRLATGGGFATRTLYENREEEIFDAQRPAILNGISQVATRPDLVDRAIVITLPPIPDAQRRPEADFWKAFDEARPRILGALLDAVVIALRRHQDVRLESLPRMADFAVWSVAAEPAFPWPTDTFLSAYAGNRQGAVDDVLDGDPLVEVVRSIAPWTGTASQLLTTLNAKVADDVKRQKGWFSRPRQVADALRRLAPGLRRTGIEVAFTKHGHTRTRLIEIGRVSSSASSASSAGEDSLEHSEIAADACADDTRTQGDHSSAGSSAHTRKNSNVSAIADAADAADASAPLFSAHVEEVL